MFDTPDESTQAADLPISGIGTDEPRLDYLLLTEIVIDPGHNPRRHFDAAAMDELVASIKEQGVITPITVRPAEGHGYVLVAGERRFLCAKRAGLTEIPALIRIMTPREAMAAAVAENGVRQDISVAEEAQVSRQAVDLAEGDYDEAARLLGWSLTKLRTRLLLLNATQQVLDAQMKGEIKLGHAELLASLPDDKQAPVLARVIEHKVSVDELKRQLGTFTQDLATAAFDIKGCAGCPHNSTTQASLFDQNVGDGRCSNRTCWSEKTQAFLTDAKTKAATEHNVVWFDSEKAPGTYTRVTADGANGLGADQVTACKSCANNGALICSAPGKEGKVAGDVCFDLSCHAKLVAARQEALRPAAPPTDAPDPSPTPKAKAQPEKVADKAPAPKQPVAAAQPQVLPKRVLADHVKRYRQIAAEAVSHSVTLQSALDLYALYKACSCRAPSDQGLPEAFTIHRANLRDFMLLDAEQASRFRTYLHHQLMTADERSGWAPDAYTHDAAINAVTAIALSRTAVAKHFVLDEAYLEVLTKPMIEALLIEAEFHRSLEGDTEEAQKKAFRKFIAQGRADLIKGVLTSRHDWKGFVPSALRAGLSKTLAADKKVERQIVARHKAAATTTQE